MLKSVVPPALGLVLACAVCLGATPARAGVVAQVDRGAQRMRVYVDGALAQVWPVSTARSGFVTPPGQYRVYRLERWWWSRKYGGAMPYALFYRGGYAIHGTAAVGRLGRPASHGCVRLAPGHARWLFRLVHDVGGARVVIR
ncbi:L,D-transpeptidase [Methylobacterium oryzisoli]|uniref:L,D-transpeptidase n=1 Tax=Methylobacterium oryzisoli TaxID=3385502 RepID=UPI003892C71E